MAYIGSRPADKALQTSDIEDSAITSAKIADGTIASGDLASGVGGKSSQLVSTVITSTASVSSTTFADMSGCNVTITPSATNSKILLFGTLVLANSTQYSFGKFVRSIDGGSYADVTGFIGDAASSRIRTSFENLYQGYDAHLQRSVSFNLLDNSHNTTSAIIYKLQVRLSSGSTTIYLNQDPNNGDDTSSSRAVSTIHAMEILA